MDNVSEPLQPQPLGPQPSQGYQIPHQSVKGSKKFSYLLAVAIIIFLVTIAAIALLFFSRPSVKPLAYSAKGCVARVFSEGSSGHCVSDIQTLINAMKTGGYTECSFQDAASLPVSGSFSESTKTQVESVQKWFNCYTSQEGQQGRVAVSGQVNRSTWGELCSYGYLDPQRSSNHTSPFYSRALIAGRDADCSSILDVTRVV